MKKQLHKIIATLNKITDKSFLKKLESISDAILSMRGRVTMLGISRWNDKHSYKRLILFYSQQT